MSDIATRMARLFRGNQTHHYTANIRLATRGANGKMELPERGYQRCDGPATPEAFEKHLQGELGLLVVPVTEKGECWFGKIDLDIYNNQLDAAALAEKVAERGLPLIVELSKSGGAHLSHYKHRAVSAAAMREELARYAAELGYAQVEIFPTQDAIRPGTFGNGINLPYFGGYNGARNAAVNRSGQLLAAEEWLAVAEKLPAKPIHTPGNANCESAAAFLAERWTDGKRNRLNTAVIGTMIHAGVDDGDTKQLIELTQQIAGDRQTTHGTVERFRAVFERGGNVQGFPTLTDPVNDLLTRDEGLELLRLMGGDPPEPPVSVLVGPVGALATPEEFNGEPFQVPVIVPQYLIEDAGGIVGPGGHGKTTLTLSEAVQLRLGGQLYGREIQRPGPSLIITAEDERAVVFGRVNAICSALGLTATQREHVRSGIFVEDITASFAKLAIADKDGAIRPAAMVGEIVEKYGAAGLAQCVLDPTSLIGPGERFGNDGFAELLRVCRFLSKQLRCAVRLVHHVSQAVFREGIKDQYAGRGGTAFVDGARFQHQLVTVKERKFDCGEEFGGVWVLPPDLTDEDLLRGRVLAVLVHKLSYAERDRVPIFVERRGFAFTHCSTATRATAGNALTAEQSSARARVEAEALCAFLVRKLDEGLYLTRNEVRRGYTKDLGMTRDQIEKAITEALNMRLLTERPLPSDQRQGRRLTYLQPNSTEEM